MMGAKNPKSFIFAFYSFVFRIFIFDPENFLYGTAMHDPI